MKIIFLLLLSLLNIFVVAHASDERDLEVCRKVYMDELRPQIVNLIPRERVYSDFEAILPYWTTCQYRCYRCHLTDAAAAMESLERMLKNSEQNEPRVIVTITGILNSIDHSFSQTCYDRWSYDNKLNNTLSKF